MGHAFAVDNLDNDGRIMRRNFFKELCKRDREANKIGRAHV